MGKDKQIRNRLLLVLKGMGMGAADVVPGVSGGTIAFIVGIYDELILAIRSVNRASIGMLLKGEFAAFWRYIHGNFLFSIVVGIGISVFSLAKLITWLLSDYPVLVWAFFFGLVLASSLLVGKSIARWSWRTLLALLLGAALAFYITIATPAETPTHPLFIVLCGAIAICAMILPGISGSFILVLLGKYHYIMESIKELNVTVLLTFMVGAVLGITSFSRLLAYALAHARSITLATLTGFMLGSLGKVWPWKVNDINVAPHDYVLPALLLMVVGFFSVLILERISKKQS